MALTGGALTTGCGAKTPDYQSVWATSSTPTTTTAPEDLVPISKYLEDHQINGQAVAPNAIPDLRVSIPTPKGWSKRENPKLPKTTEVIGKGDKFPRAILTVFKLNGDFDPAELAKHGLVDTEATQNFTPLDSSTADYGGFPSTMVQGSLDLEGQRMQSWYRVVVATGSPPDNQRYLVQLTIASFSGQAAAQAADVEEIMKGFTVAAK
ncbi:MAG: LpqN/LpqT family lipoprotein [Mycobacterium sp.]